MDIANYLLGQLKKKMDDVIIEENSNISTQIKFANNKIVKTGTEQLKDIGIFAVKNKRIVSTSFREMSMPDDALSEADMSVSKTKADELIKKVVSFVKFINPKEDYYGLADGKFKYSKILEGYDSEVRDMDSVDYVEKGINAALKEKAKRVGGILENHESKRRVLTSNGVDVNSESTNLYFSLRAHFNEKASGHVNCCSRVLKKFDVEECGKEAGKIAYMARNPVECDEGKYDVVFDPMALTALLSNVSESLSIFNVESSLSFLGDKIGEKVASSKVSLVDDPLMQNGYGSTSFDDEGRNTQRNVLVDKGILKTYYHNTSTAKKYNVKPTGNAGLISPDSFNFELVKGNKSKDKIISSVDNGILITNVWYTRFNNYSTGDFSTIPRDGMFLIKNGKITKSLKNLRVSDNMLKILENMSEIGSNATQMVTWEAENNVKCPSVLIDDVNMSKAKD
jgi:PmbA protein